MGQAEDDRATASAFAPRGTGGMIRGMTSAKVAISLPKAVLARARAAVRRGEAASLSAYVSKAIEERTNGDDLMKMLDEMLDETGGPPTPAEQRWADRVLGITKATPKPRRSR